MGRLRLEDQGAQEQISAPPPGTEVKIAVDLSRSKWVYCVRWQGAERRRLSTGGELTHGAARRVSWILAITRSASSRWFLGLLACRDDLRQLARFRSTTLRAILRIGVKHAAIITAWQRTAYFSEDVEWVGPMIIADARRLLVLLEEIQRLEKQITATAPASQLYQRMTSVPGFGLVSCAELAGEIGDRRFDGEASLALYLGATSLDNTSGQQQGTKTARQVNRRAKAALINAVDHHRRGAVPASRRR